MNKRIIKFRIWDTKANKYYSWDEIWYSVVKVPNGCFQGQTEEIWCSFFGMAVNNPNMIVQQFTGLLDKNGKEIYEGDIVCNKYVDSSGILHEQFCVMCFGKYRSELHMHEGIGFYLEDINENKEIWFNFKDFIVVGNIFENPELIKV